MFRGPTVRNIRRSQRAVLTRISVSEKYRARCLGTVCMRYVIAETGLTNGISRQHQVWIRRRIPTHLNMQSSYHERRLAPEMCMKPLRLITWVNGLKRTRFRRWLCKSRLFQVPLLNFCLSLVRFNQVLSFASYNLNWYING
jgi:hypothetical protein